MLSVLIQPDFNVFADSIPAGLPHEDIADIVDVWYAVNRPDMFGHIITPIIRDEAWFKADSQPELAATPEWVAYLEQQNKQLNTELADALDEVDRLRRLIIQIEQVCNVALPD